MNNTKNFASPEQPSLPDRQLIRRDIKDLVSLILYPCLTRQSVKGGALSATLSRPEDAETRTQNIKTLDFSVPRDFPEIPHRLQQILLEAVEPGKGFDNAYIFKQVLLDLARDLGWSFATDHTDLGEDQEGVLRDALLMLRQAQRLLGESIRCLEEQHLSTPQEIQNEVEWLIRKANDFRDSRVLPRPR